MKSRRCTAVCQDGTPCRAWAVRGSDPPRCSSHGGVRVSVKRRLDEQAGDEGTRLASDLQEDCTIEAVIAALYQQQRQLDEYLRRAWDSDIDLRELTHLLRVHGQNAYRLGRLLRDQRALSGEAADGIAGAMAMALTAVGNEMGIDL